VSATAFKGIVATVIGAMGSALTVYAALSLDGVDPEKNTVVLIVSAAAVEVLAATVIEATASVLTVYAALSLDGVD
jgi:hypothetical protein